MKESTSVEVGDAGEWSDMIRIISQNALPLGKSQNKNAELLIIAKLAVGTHIVTAMLRSPTHSA